MLEVLNKPRMLEAELLRCQKNSIEVSQNAPAKLSIIIGGKIVPQLSYLNVVGRTIYAEEKAFAAICWVGERDGQELRGKLKQGYAEIRGGLK